MMNREQFKELCKFHRLNFDKVTQNPNGTIDYDGNVNLYKKRLTKIPLQFNHVTGNFFCSRNPALKSLIGSPKIIDGDFYCYKNPGLKTLVGGPKKVDGTYFCFDCKNLKSLKGVAKFIGEDFNCTYTPNLSPSEMTYLLFYEIGGNIKTGNAKADEIFKKYQGKKEMIGQAVRELKEMS